MQTGVGERQPLPVLPLRGLGSHPFRRVGLVSSCLLGSLSVCVTFQHELMRALLEGYCVLTPNSQELPPVGTLASPNGSGGDTGMEEIS